MLKVNAERHPELAGEMGIHVVPSTFLKYKGEFVTGNFS